MTDKIDQFMRVLKEFVEVRGWEEFHTPKNLSMALAAEVGELLEIFQWDSGQLDLTDPEIREKIEGEFADIFIYLLHFANSMGIRPLEVAHAKHLVNEGRFAREYARELADDQFRDHIFGKK